MPPLLSREGWAFNVDALLNRFVLPSPVRYLPAPVRHFAGHRDTPPRKLGNLIVIAWAFVGVFCGVSVVNVVTAHVARFRVDDGATAITVGSFGAAAVLEFYAIESPLAQPRNAVFGQVVSSLVGVAVARLFHLMDTHDFERLRWLGGSIACAAATAMMALTGTVHPPAGATALIAVTDTNIFAMSWWLVPAVLLGSLLMQAIALLVNNCQRRYPVYWWTPEPVGQFWGFNRAPASSDTQAGGQSEKSEKSEKSKKLQPTDSAANRLTDSSSDPESGLVAFSKDHGRRIVLSRNAVEVPDAFDLRPEERLLLEALCERL